MTLALNPYPINFFLPLLRLSSTTFNLGYWNYGTGRKESIELIYVYDLK